MKPARTWILIADGSRARIVEIVGPGHELHCRGGHDLPWQSRFDS